jgi:hypothetical protein
MVAAATLPAKSPSWGSPSWGEEVWRAACESEGVTCDGRLCETRRLGLHALERFNSHLPFAPTRTLAREGTMLTAARCTSWRPCAGVAPVLSTTSLLGSTAARRAVLHPPPPVHAQRQRRRVTTNCRGRRADDSMSSSVVSQHAGQATDATPGSALKVVVVGAGPVGLAAAVALARPGADVEVHDDRLRGGWLDPQHGAEGCGTLVALGAWGRHSAHAGAAGLACLRSSCVRHARTLPAQPRMACRVPSRIACTAAHSRALPTPALQASEGCRPWRTSTCHTALRAPMRVPTAAEAAAQTPCPACRCCKAWLWWDRRES